MLIAFDKIPEIIQLEYKLLYDWDFKIWDDENLVVHWLNFFETNVVDFNFKGRVILMNAQNLKDLSLAPGVRVYQILVNENCEFKEKL